MANFKRVDNDKLFPMTIAIGAASAVIYADGTAEGDAEAWAEELAKIGVVRVEPHIVQWYWSVSRALRAAAERKKTAATLEAWCKEAEEKNRLWEARYQNMLTSVPPKEQPA